MNFLLCTSHIYVARGGNKDSAPILSTYITVFEKLIGTFPHQDIIKEIKVAEERRYTFFGVGAISRNNMLQQSFT